MYRVVQNIYFKNVKAGRGEQNKQISCKDVGAKCSVELVESADGCNKKNSKLAGFFISRTDLGQHASLHQCRACRHAFHVWGRIRMYSK